MVQLQVSEIKGRDSRKAVYSLAHSKPSPLFGLSRKGVFKVEQNYAYTRDGTTLIGEEALEAVREDVTSALESFGYRGREPVRRHAYSLACDRNVMIYLRTMIELNRWLLPDQRD